MDKTEIIVGDFKLKRINSDNWQLFERREIKDNGRRENNRAGEVDWVGLPAFYGTLLPALVRAKELNRARKAPTGDLDAAIEAIRKADAAFLREVRKAVG